jgi:hypothetical protein
MQGLHRLHLQNVHSQQQGSLCCGHNTIFTLHSRHPFFAASTSPFYSFNTKFLSFTESGLHYVLLFRNLAGDNIAVAVFRQTTWNILIEV